jgi:hypothetical protein
MNNEAWNRENLYKEVWSDPLTKVAKRYNMSDVAIAKACRKLKIPLPGRGYWARMAAGQKVAQEPLPNATDIPIVEHTVKDPAPAAKPEAPPDPELLRIQELRTSGAFVPSRSEQSLMRHPLVKITKQAFVGATTNSRGILMPHSISGFDLSVTRESLQRAILIAARLIEVWEQQGLKVSLGVQNKGTVFHIFNEQIEIKVAERVKQERIENPSSKYSWDRWITKYYPTGDLVVRLPRTWPTREWRDSAHKKLEEMIPECVAGIMDAGVKMLRNSERIQRDELERRRKSDEMYALRQQIEAEEKKIAELEATADRWRRAVLIRQFVDAYLLAATVRGDLINPDSVAGNWVLWAKEQADRLDPLTPSPPSVVDRKHELRGI